MLNVVSPLAGTRELQAWWTTRTRGHSVQFGLQSSDIKTAAFFSFLFLGGELVSPPYVMATDAIGQLM